ncbi:MAG: FtsH protease activity modulator HflK [SAR202 cluster bacterium]|jgi:membrane protease subunit HflK|nr:FtsH protease activity modulator HflK [SAR202 cluster bacterium]|tara:strand:+ start:6175 stop:7326 length:1152 start_codon:yes stop_codon:yes gene_type:complete
MTNNRTLADGFPDLATVDVLTLSAARKTKGKWMYRPEEPEVKIEQIIERIRKALGRFKLGGGGGAGWWVVNAAFVAALAIWLGSGFYTVQPGEQAALRLTGKFADIKGPGLHWYWPTPIGARDIVSVDQVRKLEIGVRGGTPVLDESLMITGDPDEQGQPGEAPNIVDVQLLVQYDIKDVEKFLYRAVDPAGATIVDATETALRQVIGSRPIDDVLTDQKEAIQADTKDLLQGLLDDYNTGINIRVVQLLNVFAPEQVKDAFDDVVRAKEDKARIINLADAYKEDILPRARGEAARLVQAAEAFKQEKVAIAEGQAARFLSILAEYEKAKDVTRQRLYLEAMEEMLPGITKFIVSEESGGGLLQFLPLTEESTSPVEFGVNQQ